MRIVYIPRESTSLGLPQMPNRRLNQTDYGETEVCFELLESVRAGDVEKVRNLLVDGADPNVPDIMNGSTCVHAAVAGQEMVILKILLENGADPNVPTENTESSALGTAALHGFTEVAKLLLENGARLSARDLQTQLLKESKGLGHSEVVTLIEGSMLQW